MWCGAVCGSGGSRYKSLILINPNEGSNPSHFSEWGKIIVTFS